MFKDQTSWFFTSTIQESSVGFQGVVERNRDFSSHVEGLLALHQYVQIAVLDHVDDLQENWLWLKSREYFHLPRGAFKFDLRVGNMIDAYIMQSCKAQCYLTKLSSFEERTTLRLISIRRILSHESNKDSKR